MPRALLSLFVVALALYCVVDILSSPDERRGGAPKFMWVVVALVPILGPIIWLVFVNGRRSTPVAPHASDSTQYPAQSAGYQRRNNFQRPGPVAPDDDPEFLWKLAAEQRKKREAQQRPDGASSSAEPSHGTENDRTGSAEANDDEGDSPTR